MKKRTVVIWLICLVAMYAVAMWAIFRPFDFMGLWWIIALIGIIASTILGTSSILYSYGWDEGYQSAINEEEEEEPKWQVTTMEGNACLICPECNTFIACPSGDPSSYLEHYHYCPGCGEELGADLSDE